MSFESFTRVLIMLWLSPVISYEMRSASIFITSILPIYHLLLTSQYFIMPVKKEKDTLLDLRDIAVETGIKDLAEHHDHYLYGVDGL